ncbi:gamma-glutamyl-gamma-aminobutyrate hydrolase family protein [Rugosimonospora africana]|uniref:Gamma-glutamyl-gamma-aminobutyrate hydrolase n=1 Tax=Rugosimonospora africana TaxID=556532 RepID=A0A8J3VP73_9ACTN|nr:gamma-glutamyl-gamma-aminobutyrate hydrolase family protein [Rugosimonospora africana]GIH13662.1 gamma-glutamyl-gamma-aminobutyrate hydrolase [Rugosimonospora africana]
MSPSARPVIGITCYVEDAAWGVWHTTAALLPYSYVRQVTAAGAQAVLLPYVAGQGPDDLGADLLGRLDGLLLAGGADVDPRRYGAPAHPSTVSRPDRDAGELALLDAALRADLPVLGVCRGMQLLTVAAGGSLHQHLPEDCGHERHQPAPGRYGEHPVTVTEGSRLHAILGPAPRVNSYHHQAVADPGTLAVTARADDGVIEALEDPARRFVLGVQWHPEELPDLRLFEALVAAASVTATAGTALGRSGNASRLHRTSRSGR